MNKAVEIEVKGRKILLKMPKNEADISFVRGILYSRWNKDLFLWELPHYPGNLEKLESYFGKRISKLTKEELHQSTTTPKTTIEKTEILAIITQNRRIKLLFGYFPTLIKTIPYTKWDSKNK